MESSSPIARRLAKALPADIKTLLAKIHYAPSLIEFFQVAENLAEILPVASDILGEEYSGEIGELRQAVDCVNDAMPQLNEDPKLFTLRPLRGVGVEGHFPKIKESYPLYVALGFKTAVTDLENTYHLLQAYILTGIIHKGVSREDLPPGNTTRLEAFRQVRNLATFDLQAILARLPAQPSKTPQDYIKHLVECGAPELTEIIIFLRDLFEVKERGGLGNQASHSSGRRSSRRFEEGEEDPESGRDVVAISPLTEQQRDDYETRGGCPDEIQSRTVSVDPGTGGLEARTRAEIRKLKAAARERLNRVATANQGLHYDWSELTVDEAASLLMSLSVDRLDVDPVARICLLTSFWTGRPVEDVLQLHFSTHQSKRDGFSGLVVSGENVYWQIYSPGPDVKRRNYDKAVPVNPAILLKVPPSAEGFVKKYLTEFLAGKRSEIPLFSLRTEDGVARCTDFLGKLRGERYPRITLNRIANFLVAQIARSPSGEIAVADLITGIDHPRSHNKIHYTTISTKALQKLYGETCRSIEARLLRSHLLVDPDKVSLTGSSSESYTGSPLRPQEGAVRNLVASMLGDIRTAKPNKAWANAEIAAFHNTFTLYTTQMLKSCAGIRAIRNPSIEFRHLDLGRGFAVIGDKLRDDGMGRRMIWLPPLCVRQLKYYSAHLEAIFSRCAHLSPSLMRLFARQRGSQGLTDLVLLDQNLEASILTPALIEESLRSRYGYDLPANTNRHTLRSRLLESGCPPEVIDACMGHAEVGEEPWTRYSFLHPHDYANTLKKHLLPILNQDGWVAVPGLERSLELTDLVLDTTGWPLPNPETTPYAPPRTASTALARDAVQDTLQRLQPQMLRQEPSLSLSKEDVDAIVDNLKRRKGLEIWRCIDELNNLILKGRENLGWEIPTTSRHMKVMREKPLVIEETFEYLAVCRGVEKSLAKSLERPAPGNLQARLGQLLLSAIIWGGLQESRWVRAWPNSLAKGMQLWQDWLWVDIDIAPDSAQDAQEGRDTAAWRNHRIWVADPVTQLLLLRWIKQFPQDRSAAGRHGAWSCIQAYLKTLPGKFTRPDNLSQLLEVAAARSATTLPGALAAYATGELPSISMSKETWHRFMTDRPVIVSRPAKQGEIPAPPRPLVPYSEPNNRKYDPRRQQPLFKDMMRLFPVKTDTGVTRASSAQASLKTFAATHAGELSPVLELLIQWAIQLFEKRKSLYERRLGRRLRVSTVRSYLATIGEDLLLELERG